jgi:hypothetical protein
MIPEMPPQRNVKPQTGEKLYCLTGDRRAPADQPPGRFVADSPLEGSGFELTVPLGRATASNLFLSPSKHLNPGDRRLSFRSAAAMIDR